MFFIKSLVLRSGGSGRPDASQSDHQADSQHRGGSGRRALRHLHHLQTPAGLRPRQPHGGAGVLHHQAAALRLPGERRDRWAVRPSVRPSVTRVRSEAPVIHVSLCLPVPPGAYIKGRFTQRDVDRRAVVFVLPVDVEVTADSFQFRLTDPAGNTALPEM